MKRFLSFLLVSVMLLGILAACGGTTATTVPAATTAAATTAPATDATAVPATDPTAAPGGGTSTGPEVTGEVTLWHAYGTGSAEEATIAKLIANAQAANPNATINVLQVPFSDIFNKFQNEVAAGGGPDLFVAPNDSLGDQVRASLLLDITDKVKDLPNLGAGALEGMTVDGKIYGVPESFKAVGLFYNTSTVATPPTTTDELLAAVKAGKKLVLNQNAYHSFGFYQAFGGKVLDGSNCGLTTGGTEAVAYLQELKAAGATFVTDGGQGDSLFKEGKADMIINGPWALGDYRGALGDKLAVAAMPAGPAGPAGPLTGVDGFYLNINSVNPDGALALALFLTNTESQQIYTDEAGHTPVSTLVKITDPTTQGFADAAKTGVARPQDKEFSNYWGPFGDVFTKAIEGGADAKTTIAEACTAMDTANK